jgi:hypothetical protein
MSESIFIAEGESYRPTEHARGPWDPRALHGGAPAALITAAFERAQPGAELRIGRLVFEFLRPIPLAPLRLATRIVRPGRRIQELAAELHAGDELIARASALRVGEVPAGAAAAAAAQEQGATAALERLSGPESGKPVRFALNDSADASFAATAMEMRWLSDPAESRRSSCRSAEAAASERAHSRAPLQRRIGSRASSIAASVSPSSSTPEADALACTCSGRLAPTIAEATFC